MWEEAFTFFIHNPKSQELEVEVLKRGFTFFTG